MKKRSKARSGRGLKTAPRSPQGTMKPRPLSVPQWLTDRVKKHLVSRRGQTALMARNLRLLHQGLTEEARIRCERDLAAREARRRESLNLLRPDKPRRDDLSSVRQREVRRGTAKLRLQLDKLWGVKPGDIYRRHHLMSAEDHFTFLKRRGKELGLPRLTAAEFSRRTAALPRGKRKGRRPDLFHTVVIQFAFCQHFPEAKDSLKRMLDFMASWRRPMSHLEVKEFCSRMSEPNAGGAGASPLVSFVDRLIRAMPEGAVRGAAREADLSYEI